MKSIVLQPKWKKKIQGHILKYKKKYKSILVNIYDKLYKNRLSVIRLLLCAICILLVVNIISNETFTTEIPIFHNPPRSLISIEEDLDLSSYIEVGTGLLAFNREEDIEYIVKDGDTLPEIAYLYGMDMLELGLYNELDYLSIIDQGQKLVIPTINNIKDFMDTIDKSVVVMLREQEKKPKPLESLIPASVNISTTKEQEGQEVTVYFSVDTKISDQNGIEYIWDLGNGQKSFNKTATHVYTTPGTYTVLLTVKDKYGNKVESNKLFVDIPHVTNTKNENQRFITVNDVGDLFSLPGKVIQIEDYLSHSEKPIEYVKYADGKYYYQTNASGYYSLVASSEGKLIQVYLFVSPIESIHSDRSDMNWYRTQYNTGPSNCGPTVVSMGIGWAKGEYISVLNVREQIGWVGDGGTSLFDLKKAFLDYDVEAFFTEILCPQDLLDIIDRQNIAILLYHCGKISWAEGKPEFDLIGRYYRDSVGHYVVLKGYTTDKKYVIVYDPLPSDWFGNSKRYGDGISMIGRNRYYTLEEVFSALNTRVVLEIDRKKILEKMENEESDDDDSDNKEDEF